MSEAEEVIETGEVDDTTSEIETPEVTDAPKDKPAGYLSAEQWEAQGNDPADYKTPEAFKEAGKWIGITKELRREMDEMKADFGGQVQGLNQLHQVQRQNQTDTFNSRLADLETQRDAAITDFNQDGATAAQNQINELHQANNQVVQQAPAPVQPVPQGKDPAVLQFERENPWSMTPGPKQSFANAQFNLYQSQGKPIEEALNMVKADVHRAYPDTNPNRDTPPSGELPSGPGKKRVSRAITTNDLTAEEAHIWQHNSAMWGGDEAKFLKAVENDRKGAQ